MKETTQINIARYVRGIYYVRFKNQPLQTKKFSKQ